MLEGITGGELNQSYVNELVKFFALYKRQGITKNSLLEMTKNAWGSGPSEVSTDGSKEDYEALIKIIEEVYDKQ